VVFFPFRGLSREEEIEKIKKGQPENLRTEESNRGELGRAWGGSRDKNVTDIFRPYSRPFRGLLICLYSSPDI
jgi:hypothetical protein